MNRLKILEVRSEIGAGKRGASLGIDALHVASHNAGESEFFISHELQVVPTFNEVLMAPTVYKHARYVEAIYANLQRVSNFVSDTLLFRKAFPVVLSGDHSSAYGTIAGIKSAYPDKRLGVIWIDAHADLNTPYTTPSGNMHGMPLAMATATDNAECGPNTLDDATRSHWEAVKSLSHHGPKVQPQDIVFVAVRSTEECEDRFIAEHGIKNFTTEEVNQKGIIQVVEEALAKLSGCDMLYISFDVDSTDSRFSVGTGTPVLHGLSPDQALQLNELLVQNEKVVCWEMTEINPTLDAKNKMAEYGFEVLKGVTEALESRFEAS